MAEDLAYCLDRVRQLDRERYLTALFAPADRRADLIALYAFNLEIATVRERAREPIIGQMRLQWWRDTIAGFAEGKIRDHAVARPLAGVIARHGIGAAEFEPLLTARENDLDDAPPHSLAALEAYAEGSSAALVWLALAVLGAREDAAREAGRGVGIAWALTGVLRAIPFHARQGRTLLPTELTAAAGLDPARPFDGAGQAPLAAVVERIADVARQHLRDARRKRDAVSRSALPALLHARLADLHLSRLRRAGHDSFAASVQAEMPSAALRLALARAIGRY